MSLSSAIGAFIGLVLATIVLVIGFDPILSQTFAQPLSDPTFANSIIAPLWRLMSLIFQLHLDILVMWIAVIRTSAGGS